jgi:hypothetical protein
MRLPRTSFSLVLLALITVATAAIAAGATPPPRFLVTGQGKVTKTWWYATSTTADGCTTWVTGHGSRTIALRTPLAGRLTASWASVGKRVRFAGKLPLAGAVTETGTRTTRQTGAAGCDRAARTVTCPRMRATVGGRSIGLVSRRAHRVGSTRLRGVVPGRFLFARCPGEPAEVRGFADVVEIPDASFRERDVFDRGVVELTLRAHTDATTELSEPEGTVDQRVRWTLRLRRAD